MSNYSCKADLTYGCNCRICICGINFVLKVLTIQVVSIRRIHMTIVTLEKFYFPYYDLPAAAQYACI